MMFRQAALEKLNQYFMTLAERPGRCVFFYRFSGTSPEVAAFLRRYYEAARKNGAAIDGRLKNPDARQLAYFSEMQGMEFRLERGFLAARLQSWLPRLSPTQREALSEAIFTTLQELRQAGKNDNMLRNAYIKYMCWLYYRFEHMVNRLGAEELPKIIYCGNISGYELQLLSVLSRVGADIVLVEPEGDGAYAQVDAASAYSRLYQAANLTPFAPGFSLKVLQQELARANARERLYGPAAAVKPCTNAWLKQPELAGVLTPVGERGTGERGQDSGFFYNCFIAQYGVADKLTFSGELFELYKRLQGQKRRICVLNAANDKGGRIPAPTPEEIGAIRRQPYTETEQLVSGLARNISAAWVGSPDLQRLMTRAFMDIVFEAGEEPGASLPKLTNGAVYLLCWLKRYYKELFGGGGGKFPEPGVFILFGGCAGEHEARFLRLLSRLPVDVLLIQPDLTKSSALRDPSLLELRFGESLALAEFPTEQSRVRVSTAAYQAERELDSMMYQDTGLYRNQQYTKAESITLKTMYEEIAILWDQELKYRPSFQVVGDTVTLPVLLEKICGVRDGQVSAYWQEIRKLVTPDTLVVAHIPWPGLSGENPLRSCAVQFLQNRRLKRDKIKAHKAYRYGILRGEMQEYLLDKLQLLLDQRLIAGTFENGTEYAIIAVALNLPKELVRLIQRFDFTKKNPKLIVINTQEEVLSLEESILAAFLNLVGFDILFFVPTGYQCIERHFRQPFANEQQLGEYIYDLTPPDFASLPGRSERSTRRGGFRNPIRRLFGKDN